LKAPNDSIWLVPGRRDALLREAVLIERERIMLRWTLIFLVIALIAARLGFGNLAGEASDIARILFFVFLVLTLVGLILGLITDRKPPLPSAV
jgi:uncharacterized membrane protein YtjA (UPF0391 family)